MLVQGGKKMEKQFILTVPKTGKPMLKNAKTGEPVTDTKTIREIIKGIDEKIAIAESL